MLGDITIANNIYIITGYTDMRKSIDGLCSIIVQQLHNEPDKSSIYLFCVNAVIVLNLFLKSPMEWFFCTKDLMLYVGDLDGHVMQMR